MARLNAPADERLIAGKALNEDGAVLRFPNGKALIQSLDFFTPIVDDPYRFGQIAAANALSDIYAMGGEPYCAMNIVCFPAKTMDKAILAEILRGGLDKVTESGALLVGGHSVEDKEIKYGLSVSGIVDEEGITANDGLCPGDLLVLTKPLGTGVLATAIKGKWEGADSLEEELWRWAARLNKGGGQAIREAGLKAATDVTGFGLGGHLLEMAKASNLSVELWAEEIPLLDQARELALVGMIPAGSFANKGFCRKMLDLEDGLDEVLVDLVFDAQTSGGLVLAVPEEKLSTVVDCLERSGDMACVVGRVLEQKDGGSKLSIRAQRSP